jgi:putative transcriptional regulator
MLLNKSINKPVVKPLKAAAKKPMTDAQLAKWETSRDLEAELLESVRQMQRGEGTVVYSPVIAARQNSKLSQAQGRKQPSGAARTLITLAQRNPKALRDLADA